MHRKDLGHEHDESSKLLDGLGDVEGAKKPTTPRPSINQDQGSGFLCTPTGVMAGVFYCTCSAALILLNKHALASFGFECTNSLLLYQCIIAAVLVKIFEVVGVVTVEPLKWDIVKIWFPVNLLFVGMLVSGFFALKLVGVGMFTVLKNLTNFLTISGDYYFYGRTYSLQVWASLFFMFLSAICAGVSDVRFNLEGYIWQAVNCVFTAAYALYLSGVMDRVVPYTSNKQRLGEFSMVYYNNLLSIPLIVILVTAWGEWPKLPQQEALGSMQFQAVAFIAGILGFMLSFSSLWFMSRTTATVYGLTGSLNKILVATVGIAVFQEATSFNNLASISVGLVAGVLFVMAKSSNPKK